MDQLFHVWELADHNGDGLLDAEEFALAMYLCHLALEDPESVPDTLPSNLVPPSQR